MKIKEILNEIIKQEGNKWVLYSKKGKVLGKHKTKKAAEKQEAAINISKSKE